MAPAHGDVASGGRRRGRRRNLSWGTLFCFGSQEALAEGTIPWERSRRWREKRTVPVDGDLVGTTAADPAVMRRGSGSDEKESRKRKGLRLAGCCFLAPARAPGREHSAMDSSSSGRNKQRHPERTEQQQQQQPRRRSHSDENSASEASRIQATSCSTSNGSRSHGAEQPRSPPAETTRRESSGVGAFGPVVGLSVVVAVSMAGLLGGRLWAVACVCALLAALSRLRRPARCRLTWTRQITRNRPCSGDCMLERDRRKAVAAA